jgi:hypothetical protein
MRLLRRAFQWAIAVLVVGVVWQEMKKPPETRTWQGKVFGWVPYDLRYPWINTGERLRAAYWNPDDERVLTQRAFGIGWGVNLPALGRRAKETISFIQALIAPS